MKKIISLKENNKIVEEMYKHLFLECEKMKLKLYAVGATLSAAHLIGKPFYYDDDIDVILTKNDLAKLRKSHLFKNGEYEIWDSTFSSNKNNNHYDKPIHSPLIRMRTKENYILKHEEVFIPWKPFIDISVLFVSDFEIKILKNIKTIDRRMKMLTLYKWHSHLRKNKILFILLNIVFPIKIAQFFTRRFAFEGKFLSKGTKYGVPGIDAEKWGIWKLENSTQLNFLGLKIWVPENYIDSHIKRYNSLPYEKYKINETDQSIKISNLKNQDPIHINRTIKRLSSFEEEEFDNLQKKYGFSKKN